MERIRQLEGLLQQAMDRIAHLERYLGDALKAAQERVKLLEEHLLAYVGDDDDDLAYMPGSKPMFLAPWNRRVLASRRLLGLGHLATE